MLGGLLALFAAATFAVNNAAFRRGALVGSVAQAMAISLPMGVAIFFAAALASGTLKLAAAFGIKAVLMLCLAGVLHFAWGRYCNFRATKAMGANLVGPVQQISLIITLGLAIGVLGETLSPMRILGIALILIGSAVAVGSKVGTGGVADDATAQPAFRPRYVEGYVFALLSATGFGATPILVRMSLEDAGPAASLAGGLIAYGAATAVLGTAVLRPERLREILAIDRSAAKWFTASAVLVSLSQMCTYLALAIAPVSVVTPIQRLSIVFRVVANSLLNRHHEVLGGRVYLATGISLLGALALSLSADFLRGLRLWPEALAGLAQ